MSNLEDFNEVCAHFSMEIAPKRNVKISNKSRRYSYRLLSYSRIYSLCMRSMYFSHDKLPNNFERVATLRWKKVANRYK